MLQELKDAKGIKKIWLGLVLLLGYTFCSLMVGIFVLLGFLLLGEIEKKVNGLDDWPRWILSILIGAIVIYIYINILTIKLNKRKNKK